MQTKLKLKSAIAGKIQPIISSLFLLSKDDLHAIIHNVYDMCNMVDLVVLVSFGWLLVPAMGVVYDYSTKAHNGSKRSKGSDDDAKDDTKDKNDEDDIHIDHGQTLLKYQNSYLFLMAHHLSEMSRLALLVYAGDCIVMVFHTIGYKQHQWSLVSKVFPKILYTRRESHESVTNIG